MLPLVYKKDAGGEVYACNSLYFRSRRNLTISDKNSCILNMQPGITQRTQINSSWTDKTASCASTPKHENSEWQNGVHRKTMRTQYYAPPTHHADSLAHRLSESPMAQTADSQPPQTSHVESEQTTSAWLWKLPAQLNTPNIFVPDLVRVSPNSSDIQRLGRCVLALKVSLVPYRRTATHVNLDECPHWHTWECTTSGTNRWVDTTRTRIWWGLPFQEPGR